jgi:hypothetical protein
VPAGIGRQPRRCYRGDVPPRLVPAALLLARQAALVRPARAEPPAPRQAPGHAGRPTPAGPPARESGKGLLGMLTSMQKLEVRWEASVALPVDGQDVRASMALELAARKSQWWQLGFAYLPTTTVASVTRASGAIERTVTLREELAISLRLFKRFGPLVINAGLIESRVGAGIELRLVEDHLRLEALAHKRSRADQNLASVRIGASVQWRWFFVQAGVLDASDRRRRVAFLGGGMRWEDPDLKGLAFWLSRI